MASSTFECLSDWQARCPLMFRLKGTVILRIWWQVLLVFLYTVIVVFLHLHVPGFKMDFPTTLIGLLGGVIGLLLVFRTNTAYERYWEGRRIWGTMTQNIRALTRCIWVSVKEEPGASKDVIEKRSIINLLIAFAYATKNYLREEYSYEADGVKELLRHIPKFSETKAATVEGSNTANENNAKVNEGFSGYFDEEYKKYYKDHWSGNLKAHGVVSRTQSFMAHDCVTPTNIPIEISYHVDAYISSISMKGRDLTDPTTMVIMKNALNNLVDCLAQFERILRTPIPLAYSVHLQHCIWLFLLALPYQLVQSLNWWTVPAAVVSSFSLFGILAIGWEIENPFGYDDNDLPLDDCCNAIHNEIMSIVGQKIPLPESWLNSPLNFPLAPASMESAPELIATPLQEVRKRLAQGAVRRVPARLL